MTIRFYGFHYGFGPTVALSYARVHRVDANNVNSSNIFVCFFPRKRYPYTFRVQQKLINAKDAVPTTVSVNYNKRTIV
jgi:hypothetical protein